MWNRCVEVVGVERFELPTSCSQSRRATGLRYTPKEIKEGKQHIIIPNHGSKGKEHMEWERMGKVPYSGAYRVL